MYFAGTNFCDGERLEPTIHSKNTAKRLNIQKKYRLNIDFEMTGEFNIQIINSFMLS